MKIAIVTDDLTSATDGAGAFAQSGWRVKVLRGSVASFPAEDADLVSVDVASRNLSADEAVRRVTEAGAAVAHAPVIAKQLDSTLRGHVAAETLALLRATGRRQVILAPAFPSAGRTTVNARQLVDGVPVHESVYAQDPLSPVRSSDLAALFAQEGVEIGRTRHARTDVIALDAESEADLDAIAAEFSRRDDVILAGSTGLMRALARHKGRGTGTSVTMAPRSRRVLIVVGSVNGESRHQLEVLRRKSTPVFTQSLDDEPTAMARKIAAALGKSTAVALTTTPVPTDPARITDRLSQTVARLVQHSAIDALIVTGGETLTTILDQLGSHSLTVCHEIEPGIPLCLLHEPYNMPLVSKAGGFGSPDIFLKAVAAVSRPHR